MKLEEKILELIRKSDEEGHFDRVCNIDFKKKAKEELRFFYSRYEGKTDSKLIQLGKNDCTITPDDFNPIMEVAGLPYVMDKPEKSKFVVREISQVKN